MRFGVFLVGVFVSLKRFHEFVPCICTSDDSVGNLDCAEMVLLPVLHFCSLLVALSRLLFLIYYEVECV